VEVRSMRQGVVAAAVASLLWSRSEYEERATVGAFVCCLEVRWRGDGKKGRLKEVPVARPDLGRFRRAVWHFCRHVVRLAI
jgi:hypothetical protein